MEFKYISFDNRSLSSSLKYEIHKVADWMLKFPPSITSSGFKVHSGAFTELRGLTGTRKFDFYQVGR